jgi:hypothetical protein
MLCSHFFFDSLWATALPALTEPTLPEPALYRASTLLWYADPYVVAAPE